MKRLATPALGLILLETLMAAALSSEGVLALFGGSASIPGNTFTDDTLDPPTGLAASSSGTSIVLSWTATVDTYATSYGVLRSTTAGGPYSQIGAASPVSTTTFSDSTGVPGTRYYYVLETQHQNWISPISNEANARAPSTSGFQSCAANAPVTTGSGDNNGFQLNRGNACANDSAFAEDTNSGTGAPDTCSSSSKDRHLFYDHGFAIPAGSVINGIEVRLDAWADSTSSTPFMCVQLSWDGGTTSTAVKVTPNLAASETPFILGSVSDDWGRTWNATEFSNANFRVRITDVSSFNNRDFRLDWVAVQVTYAAP